MLAQYRPTSLLFLCDINDEIEVCSVTTVESFYKVCAMYA